MIDVGRRGFLFGLTAAAVIIPTRKYFLMPPVREIALCTQYRWDKRAWQTYRRIEYNGADYDVALMSNVINPPGFLTEEEKALLKAAERQVLAVQFRGRV